MESPSKPLPLFSALRVAWRVAPILAEVVGDALLDGQITPAEKKTILRRALSPGVIERLVEAIVAA